MQTVAAELQTHGWSVIRKKNTMQGLFEWKWGWSFKKTLICGQKKKDGLQCERNKWFLDVISIPGCEYSRRQPEPDEWSPLPASTPPRGQTRGHWSLTPDNTTFSWLEDRLSVVPSFDIDVYIDIWYSQTSSHLAPASHFPPASSRAAAPPWQIVVRLLAPKLDKWSRGGGH